MVRIAPNDMSDSELEHALAAPLERIESRSARARAESRDLHDRERNLSEADRAELAALKSEIEHRERNGALIETRSRQIDDAISQTPSPETRGRLDEFAENLAAGRPQRIQVECRSVTTANSGARAAVAGAQLGRPQWIYSDCRIPFTLADSLTISGPKFAALVAHNATAELGTKPDMTDPALATSTLGAFAVVEEISDQSVRFGAGAQVVTNRLAAESVFSVNASAAAALVTAAGTPLTFAGSASAMADLAIARVWAKTGAKPTALLVNSADYPALSAKAAVGPGDGIETPVVAFNGTPLVVNDAVTAGIGVALNGLAFSAHGTDVLFASLPNLDNNTVKLRAETYFALLQHDVGAIVAVDLVSA